MLVTAQLVSGSWHQVVEDVESALVFRLSNGTRFLQQIWEPSSQGESKQTTESKQGFIKTFGGNESKDTRLDVGADDVAVHVKVDPDELPLWRSNGNVNSFRLKHRLSASRPAFISLIHYDFLLVELDYFWVEFKQSWNNNIVHGTVIVSTTDIIQEFKLLEQVLLCTVKQGLKVTVLSFGFSSQSNVPFNYFYFYFIDWSSKLKLCLISVHQDLSCTNNRLCSACHNQSIHYFIFAIGSEVG